MSVSSVGTCSTDWWFRPPWFASRSVIRFAGCGEPHRVGYVTTSTVLLASAPATYSTAGYCRSCAPGIIWHHSQFFSCISPAMVFYYSATSFGRRSPVARSCPVAANCPNGFAVIDLSLEQSERAQGFLDTVCKE